MPAQPVASLGPGQPGREDGRQLAPERYLAPPRGEGRGIGEDPSSSGCAMSIWVTSSPRAQSLRRFLEQIGARGEQLEIRGARPRRRDETLELVEGLVGIGRLPERVEHHGEHGGERPARRRGIRGERAGRPGASRRFWRARSGSVKPVALSAV